MNEKIKVPAVEFKNVYFRYSPESETILRNVNLALDYGKVVLLTGPSGCGKTTFMSLINGTIPNYVNGEVVGDVFVNGESIIGKSISDIAHVVGSVLQNADTQIVHDIVKDEIAFGPENMGVKCESISKAVYDYSAEMKLDPEYETRKLSGGQKQRLITASTLAMGQKIVLLDEPLANLDTEGADIILSDLRRLVHEENYLVLIVEHRIDYIKDYVDEIYDMQQATPVKVTKEDILAKEASEIVSLSKKNLVNKSSSDIILSGRDISMSFGKKSVLEHISLDVHDGEKIMLLGENGCGKTTFLKILARLLKPTSGEVISSLGNKAGKNWFKQVGYVYQNPDYQLFMPTVSREIDFACKNAELRDFVIEKLELKDILEMHPFSLSQGQKRKLAVAAIVCMQPKILFLDEPTVGQDSESLSKLLDVLVYLNENYGTALVSITHDKRCMTIADRTVHMPVHRE